MSNVNILYIVKDQSSRQRGRPTSINSQVSDSNKNLVVSPRWVLDTKIDWPTNLRPNITLTMTMTLTLNPVS
jgi:hypothetical protein